MAGLVGALGAWSGEDVAAMAERLSHRGPAFSEQVPATGVRLGSVYAGGTPHTATVDGDVIVADGLLAGSPADPSERLLRLYRDGGMEAFDTLEGAFAFAIWDSRRGEVVLGRDLIGCQPLFFTRPAGGGLLFASEYKALLALEAVEAQPDREMLRVLQQTKHLPPTRTLLRGIEAVPPGTIQVLDPAGKLIRSWSMRLPPLAIDAGMDEATAEERIRTTFLRVVGRCTEGRSSIGLALSGGIDSMGLACALRTVAPDLAIHTYTAGSGPDDPEIMKAGFVAAKVGSKHREVIVDPERLPAMLPELVWHLENPIARSETAQFLEIGRAAQGEVDLVLTGAASDGLFAGMPRHKVLWAMGLVPPMAGPLAEFYALTQSGRPPQSLLGRLMDRGYFRGKIPPVPAVAGVPATDPVPNLGRADGEIVNRVLHAGFQDGVARWLPKIERTLAASGVRHFTPFLDRELVALAFSIPTRLKIHRGKEKFVLRRALRSIVPPEVLNAPKFPMRMAHGRGFHDVLRGMAAERLNADRVKRRGWFDPGEVQRLVDWPTGGSFEGQMRLWTLLVTEIWAEIFLDGRGRRPA
ncbi:MAG: asparagine synthase-related protein [Geminicoccaceae bacterium]